MYSFDMEKAIQMMREELTSNGVKELRTPSEVDEVLSPRKGTVLVIVNSVCGCAAGAARPGAIQSLKHTVTPNQVTTVFAGQDREATEQARSYFTGYPPSSPSMWLLKDGEVVFKLERYQIEHRSSADIAKDLTTAFDKHCAVDQQKVFKKSKSSKSLTGF